ncbi:hypothetical protein SAMN04488503_2237 [Humidesulfovibrio mexicanus]|uniref:Uncharacterized protein n=1 Tax=Humidesulfovibrio mexicanus TaxID=147047 RepID=A0A239AWI9_9BACT|nr:hypothetical protein [Humidesulfovibrio mexicanus]SNR99404.1 hypothetical protein SAMN04488503_2237 [Humidesulfovibrio mexicanus]
MAAKSKVKTDSGEAKKPAKKKRKNRPGGPGRPKYTIKQVKQAINGTGGIKVEICERLKCSRTTLDAYIAKHPEIAEYYKEECESVLDMAESRLFSNIDRGELGALMYYLNNKGKERGYNRPQRGDAADAQQRPVVLSLNFGPKPGQDDRPAGQPVGGGADGQ